MTREMLAKLKEEAEAAPEVKIVRNRYGYEIAGKFYRRVTTLCGGIPKPWLGSWAAKMVAEFAYDNRDAWWTLDRTNAVKLLKGAPWSKRDDAGDRGTAIHNTVEAIVRNQPRPDGLTDDEAACAAAAEAFLIARGSRVLASELTVFHDTLGYAGTLDLWEIDNEGSSWILDWKTSGGVYAEYAVQLTAYRHAEFAVVQKKRTGPEEWVGKRITWGPEKAERLGIVHVEPDGAKLYPILYKKRLWDVFRAAAFVKGWQLDVDDFAGKTPRDKVFGEPT